MNVYKNCDKYGRLYDWNTAKRVCPSGYRLPDEDDWYKLFEMAGETYFAWAFGRDSKLASRSDWSGTDDYGFSALPGGMTVKNSFNELINWRAGAYWWTATEENNDNALMIQIISASDFIYNNVLSKDYILSVRCIKTD